MRLSKVFFPKGEGGRDKEASGREEVFSRSERAPPRIPGDGDAAEGAVLIDVDEFAGRSEIGDERREFCEGNGPGSRGHEVTSDFQWVVNLEGDPRPRVCPEEQGFPSAQAFEDRKEIGCEGTHDRGKDRALNAFFLDEASERAIGDPGEILVRAFPAFSLEGKAGDDLLFPEKGDFDERVADVDGK